MTRSDSRRYNSSMTFPASKPLVTLEEYLRQEEASEIRHEFHEGEILEMTGGTYEHSLIIANVVENFELACWTLLRILESNSGKSASCPPSPRYVYPDSTIVCGSTAIRSARSAWTTIINPRVIIEVLSDSTEGYDRGGKVYLLPRLVVVRRVRANLTDIAAGRDFHTPT